MSDLMVPAFRWCSQAFLLSLLSLDDELDFEGELLRLLLLLCWLLPLLDLLSRLLPNETVLAGDVGRWLLLLLLL